MTTEPTTHPEHELAKLVPIPRAVVLPARAAGRMAQLLAAASGWLIAEPISGDLYDHAARYSRATGAYRSRGDSEVEVPAPVAMRTAALCQQAAVLTRSTDAALAGLLGSVGDALAHRAGAVA